VGWRGPSWIGISGTRHQVSLTHTFVNGTVADADQVNTNFADVAEAVADNDTRTPRAWVRFDGANCTATCPIADAYNVASVTRVAQGHYEVTFTTPMGDANYTAIGSSTDSRSVTNETFATHTSFRAFAAGSVRVSTRSFDNVLHDFAPISMVVFANP
jgi:hypothetical protein